MAKYELHNRAIDMRLQGASYSQIKEKLKVSKSSLSLWLQDYPLSPDRLKELRTNNERQIERTRATKARKREARIEKVHHDVKERIGFLTAREIFISGLFLYWAEGTKASRNAVQLTNTDPAMLKFFIQWLTAFGIDRSRLRVKMHFYADMDIQKETQYWADALDVSLSAFRKPYIKASCMEKRRNYKGRFGHGTCNLILYSRDLYEIVMMGMHHLREVYGGDGFLVRRAV